MQYNGLSWAIALVALLVLIIGGRLLLRRGWLIGWLRGTSGLLLLALAGLAAVVAWDLRSYAALPAPGEGLVTVGIEAQGNQRYRMSLQEGQQRHDLIVNGELWQLDVRLLGWQGLATLIGLRPGYRLDLLAIRYHDSGQRGGGESSRIPLTQSPHGIDIWRWLRETGWDLALFDIRGQRVTFVPLVDGGRYRVRMNGSGLLLEPLNRTARDTLAHEG